MGTLHNHPFFIRYQGGAGDHVVQISAGQTIRSGVGQSFWLCKGRCALAEVPTANRAHSFLVQVASSDQQNVNAQVAVTYCIENAEAAAAHYDFGLYPREAKKDAQGLWQIDETVTRIAHSALASTIAPLLEQLRAEADRALYERRALAVERESQISENEMQSKLDLARKRADLVDQEGHNARREAEEKAAADAIAVEAESRRIVEKAKAFETDWNTAGRARTANDAAYIQAVAEAGPEVARALALKELAGHMPSFGNITITADVLSDLVSAFTGSAKAGK